MEIFRARTKYRKWWLGSFSSEEANLFSTRSPARVLGHERNVESQSGSLITSSM